MRACVHVLRAVACARESTETAPSDTDCVRSVTILNDGDQAKQEAKAPFSEYGSVCDAVVYGDPSDPANFPAGDFDIVIDNNGKDLGACQPLIDHYKGSAKQYFFVSSAGMYIPDDVEPERVETDAVKASAGHNAVETYLRDSGIDYTIFRPQYIYGQYTTKPAYLGYYIDRIVRDKPVPIPAPGVQLTSLTNVEDVASMIVCAVGCDGAKKETFNIATDRYVSLDGVAKLVASSLGKEADIKHYDHANAGLKKGEGFPMRTVHFICSVEKAKAKLGWQPKHALEEDLAAVIADYKAAGNDTKDIDFSVDEKIFA